MFAVKPEYNSVAVESFCKEQGQNYATGSFIIRRFEDDEITGWAVFCIEGQKVTLTGVSEGTPVDVDLFIRTGINSAQQRGCEYFNFGKEIWEKLSKAISPMGYTNEPINITNFFTKCCHNKHS